ncbi:MAG: hypothetical protein K2X82_27555 [Gemmataceae bacterium]|nr:hypothetical protein [Gemmataceae bacterium]
MPARRPSARLSVSELEAREVPAALSFANGTLTINMDDVPRHSIRIDALRAGVVRVNGVNTGAGPAWQHVDGVDNGRLRSADVKKIVVNGSAFSDIINLAGVDTRGFRGLGGKVEVWGNGGSDIIDGTAFADQLHGGGANDTIRGQAGADRIWGDAGNDNLYGDGAPGAHWDRYGGDDRIDGGLGNDWLYGTGGVDLFVGGAGRDRYFGGAGRDTAYLDNLDYRPNRGGPNWVEVISTDTPPAI